MVAKQITDTGCEENIRSRDQKSQGPDAHCGIRTKNKRKRSR